MFMRQNDDVGYHARMAELQDRLRKSEEERIQLEEKFNLLLKSSHSREVEKLAALKEAYTRFLEEDMLRCDRNDILMQTLNRIESRANMLTAKTERLKLLRQHYEAYMSRMYPVWKEEKERVSLADPSQVYPLNPSKETKIYSVPPFHLPSPYESYSKPPSRKGSVLLSDFPIEIPAQTKSEPITNELLTRTENQSTRSSLSSDVLPMTFQDTNWNQNIPSKSARHLSTVEGIKSEYDWSKIIIPSDHESSFSDADQNTSADFLSGTLPENDITTGFSKKEHYISNNSETQISDDAFSKPTEQYLKQRLAKQSYFQRPFPSRPLQRANTVAGPHIKMTPEKSETNSLLSKRLSMIGDSLRARGHKIPGIPTKQSTNHGIDRSITRSHSFRDTVDLDYKKYLTEGGGDSTIKTRMSVHFDDKNLTDYRILSPRSYEYDENQKERKDSNRTYKPETYDYKGKEKYNSLKSTTDTLPYTSQLTNKPLDYFSSYQDKDVDVLQKNCLKYYKDSFSQDVGSNYSKQPYALAVMDNKHGKTDMEGVQDDKNLSNYRFEEFVLQKGTITRINSLESVDATDQQAEPRVQVSAQHNEFEDAELENKCDNVQSKYKSFYRDIDSINDVKRNEMNVDNGKDITEVDTGLSATLMTPRKIKRSIVTEIEMDESMKLPKERILEQYPEEVSDNFYREDTAEHYAKEEVGDFLLKLKTENDNKIEQAYIKSEDKVELFHDSGRVAVQSDENIGEPVFTSYTTNRTNSNSTATLPNQEEVDKQSDSNNIQNLLGESITPDNTHRDKLYYLKNDDSTNVDEDGLQSSEVIQIISPQEETAFDVSKEDSRYLEYNEHIRKHEQESLQDGDRNYDGYIQNEIMDENISQFPFYDNKGSYNNQLEQDVDPAAVHYDYNKDEGIVHSTLPEFAQEYDVDYDYNATKAIKCSENTEIQHINAFNYDYKKAEEEEKSVYKEVKGGVNDNPNILKSDIVQYDNQSAAFAGLKIPVAQRIGDGYFEKAEGNVNPYSHQSESGDGYFEKNPYSHQSESADGYFEKPEDGENHYALNYDYDLDARRNNETSNVLETVQAMQEIENPDLYHGQVGDMDRSSEQYYGEGDVDLRNYDVRQSLQGDRVGQYSEEGEGYEKAAGELYGGKEGELYGSGYYDQREQPRGVAYPDGEEQYFYNEQGEAQYDQYEDGQQPYYYGEGTQEQAGYDEYGQPIQYEERREVPQQYADFEQGQQYGHYDDQGYLTEGTTDYYQDQRVAQLGNQPFDYSEERGPMLEEIQDSTSTRPNWLPNMERSVELRAEGPTDRGKEFEGKTQDTMYYEKEDRKIMSNGKVGLARVLDSDPESLVIDNKDTPTHDDSSDFDFSTEQK